MESTSAHRPKAPLEHMTEFFQMKGLTPPWREAPPAPEKLGANENAPQQPVTGLKNLDYSRIRKSPLAANDLETEKPRYKVYK